MTAEIGRKCLSEITDLPPGVDFRLPEYRREVFLRFYEFHLENRSHPGCVYYAMPWLIERFNLDAEQKLWLAFLNGNTQNIVTTWRIFERFPNVTAGCSLAARAWFDDNYTMLAWDTDRRYHKKSFIPAVVCYAQLVDGDQSYFFQQLYGNREEDTFRRVWDTVRSSFYGFGRLTTFSYLEYLRIVGLPILCDDLFLNDMSGSKSHRNGLAKVLGRDDLDWHASTGFMGDYAPGQLAWLTDEAALLLAEAQARTTADPRDVNYFTLESALCTYKSWHRPRRRYSNCYNDMFYDRIKKAESTWGPLPMFWNMREECVPEHLRLECNGNDPGLVPEKQDHYRLTGQPIMMSRRWPVFDNTFDRRCWS